jgi:hypothetical protein
MKNRILYWTFKIPAILLLAVPFVLSIPGFILFLLSEEFDGESFDSRMHNDIKNM